MATCVILGAGFSAHAGVPLARDLFLRANAPVPFSAAATVRHELVLREFEQWHDANPRAHAEEFIASIYARPFELGSSGVAWPWVVEYVGAVIARPGIDGTMQRAGARYSNRITVPLPGSAPYARFWQLLTAQTRITGILTLNYDLVVERTLRHRPMRRPVLPGFHYGGFPLPQLLLGASRPFGGTSAQRQVEVCGTVPLYKIHGSLNWALDRGEVTTFQDVRPALRHGGDAAIVPPHREKERPGWLRTVWEGAEAVLRDADTWVVCGYSAPSYDLEVSDLLRRGARGGVREVYILDPDSARLAARYQEITRAVHVHPRPGFPSCVEPPR